MISPIGNAEEVTVPTQGPAGNGDKGRDTRSNTLAGRTDHVTSTAAIATNLYSLLAWLYEKPKA